jgi:predicted MFS family arabinose efflux permease
LTVKIERVGAALGLGACTTGTVSERTLKPSFLTSFTLIFICFLAFPLLPRQTSAKRKEKNSHKV